MHWVCLRGWVDILRLLLHQGWPNVNLPDRSGSTPLHVAATVGNHECVAVLLSAGPGVDVNAVDSSGRAPLHYAAVRGDDTIILALADASADLFLPDHQHQTALAVAQAWGMGNAEHTLRAAMRRAVHTDAAACHVQIRLDMSRVRPRSIRTSVATDPRGVFRPGGAAVRIFRVPLSTPAARLAPMVREQAGVQAGARVEALVQGHWLLLSTCADWRAAVATAFETGTVIVRVVGDAAAAQLVQDCAQLARAAASGPRDDAWVPGTRQSAAGVGADTTASIVIPPDHEPQEGVRVCAVCFEEEASFAILPCGHAFWCKKHGAMLRGKACPFCQRTVRHVQRIFPIT